MKYLISTFCLLTFIVKADAQQLQTSSFYDLQGMFQNPSTAGTQETNFIGVTYQTQWSAIPGSPETATIFGSWDLPKQKIGIGGYLYNDKTGPTSRTGLVLALAKHIVMNNGDKLSLGLENKIQQYKVDMSKLATFGSDPTISGSGNKLNYDAGFGISYTAKKFSFGASVSQLVQSQLDFYTGNLTRTEKGKLYRHYYFHGLYNIALDEMTTVTPNFVVTYLPNAPSDFQIGIRVDHKDHLWWGVGYRNKQSFMLSIGVNIHRKFMIGYAYDEFITPINEINGGGNGHEILLRYNFTK